MPLGSGIFVEFMRLPRTGELNSYLVFRDGMGDARVIAGAPESFTGDTSGGLEIDQPVETSRAAYGPANSPRTRQAVKLPTGGRAPEEVWGQMIAEAEALRRTGRVDDVMGNTKVVNAINRGLLDNAGVDWQSHIGANKLVHMTGFERPLFAPNKAPAASRNQAIVRAQTRTVPAPSTSTGTGGLSAPNQHLPKGVYLEFAEIPLVTDATGKKHGYLVFRDGKGGARVIRGGPENRLPGLGDKWGEFLSFGTGGDIELEIDEPLQNSSDRYGPTDTPKTRGAIRLPLGSQTPEAAWNVMIQQADKIGKGEIDYDVISPQNSNSVVRALLEAAKIPWRGAIPTDRLKEIDDFGGFDNDLSDPYDWWDRFGRAP